MKFSTIGTFLLLLLLFCPGGLRGQDTDLGGLPPLPDLDMGDPQRKLSWSEKRELSKKQAQARVEANIYERKPEDVGMATLGQRVSASATRNKQKNAPSQEITVRNNLPTNEDGITPSGARLKPFGQEDFWGEMPPPTPEESLIDLPPAPDLRTPDQITRKERSRDRLVAKYEQRKAEADAIREEKELKARAVVNRPSADPANALIQVESRKMSEAGYVGNQAAPETVSSGNLKPFNEGSSFYQNDQLVYKGNRNNAPVEVWWKRGTQEQGGGNDEQTKWRWRNPFNTANDDVQPVSFSEPKTSGSYAAGSPNLDATPLTSNLKGIRVVRSTGAVKKSGMSSVSGVTTEGVELPKKVYDVFSSRIGSSLTLGSLNQMVRDAVLAYRRSDLPVVDVLVPEQEISSGVLQLVVIEGRLGDVIVEGGSNDAESRALARQIRVERGEVIRESDLTEDLNWINKHPTRQVDLVFTPGDGYGETDVILRTEAHKELSAYVAMENSGTSDLGEARGIFGASWTGPLFFGEESILSYQFTTNFDEDSDLIGHSGVFANYLPWRHQVTLLGAYVETDALFALNNGNFVSKGVNKQVSGRYGIPLPSIGRLSHELELGMDFKTSNSDLSFNNLQVFDTTSEIVQYSLGYNIVMRDKTGIWRLDSEVVSSPGDNTLNNTDAVFQTQRAGATANYTYGQVTLERDQQLVDGWTAYGRLQGQGSNANLLASETIGAGGYDSVRGWEQRIARGDSGVVGSAELRTPSFYPSTFAGFSNVRDGAYGLIFYDFASLSSKDPLPGQENIEMGSVGLGFRYQREEWFTLRVDYGFQVTEEGFDDGNQGRWHVGARATF
ncbi:MAG: ShlB/FhaC/HecB family hemolysin secretion/activation protein [Verrucomicrobiales bacterium]|nr:ShlB/FhaC/HecB family hemolysin secretion/activation protein [Verrucomicrobiales bacterium]